MKTSHQRLGELDALRGIAAMAVVVFHYSTMADTKYLLLKLGITGVDLFFMISGYVILMTLERTKTEKDFIVSRLSRLYPSYILMMLFTSWVLFLFNTASVPASREILANLTMMQPFFQVGYIDESYWTLTVEMQFYFLMLLIFMFKKLHRIEMIGVFLMIVFTVYYIIGSTFYFGTKIYIVPRYLLPLISHFQMFFAGIVFYKMQKEGVTPMRHFLIAITFAISIFLFNKSGRSHFAITLIPYATMISLYVLLFYLFIYGKLKMLNVSFLTFLGSISYCLYLVHQQAGEQLFVVLNSMGLPNVASVIFLILFMVIISSIVTYFIEKPAIRFLRNLPALYTRSIANRFANKRQSSGQVTFAKRKDVHP